MNIKTKIAVISLFAATTQLFISGCGKSKADSVKLAINDSVAVKVQSISLQNLDFSKSYVANVEGEDQVNVFAKTVERITKLYVKNGDYVKEGQLVASLDKSGSSQYYQAEANYNNLLKDQERIKNLYEKGAIAQQEVDRIQTQIAVAKANLVMSKNMVSVYAPISGVVTIVNVQTGDMATMSQPLMTIATTSKLIAKFRVGENEIKYFKKGIPVTIIDDFDASNNKTGVVKNITGAADVKSRTFELEATIANNANHFKPGMYCKVSSSLFNKKSIVTIPNASILSEGEQKYVFVVNGKKVFKRNVTVGITNGTLTEITGGLELGENVVTEGMGSVRDGSLVFVVK